MSDKNAKTILRFQQRVDNKEFYEAHQTIRTIVNRYVRSRQFTPALDLLAQGSAILAKNKEYASATDLILYMILVYQDAGISCLDKERKMKLIELISLLPDTDPALSDLAKASIAWSKATDELTFGDSSIHHLFGCKLLGAVTSQALDEMQHKMFAVAELHLALGTFESLPVYVDYLFQWYLQSGACADPGQFLARAVFNYAYLKNLQFLNSAIDRFVALYQRECCAVMEQDGLVIVFPDLPLLVFLQLLAATLAKADAGGKFMKLLNHYQGQLNEYQLVAPVEYLGSLYFQLQLGNSNAGNNMLANLMGGLFK